MSRLVSAVGLCLVALISATQGAAYDLSGPWQVELQRGQLQVPGERRPVEFSLVLPLRGDADLAPLVVFSHGFSLAGDDYLSYGLHLASHGVAVALPTYPLTLWRVDHWHLAQQLELVLDYLIQEAESGSLLGRVDPSNLGLVGHSLGGKISLLVVSQGTPAVAVAALDPVDAGAPGVVDEERFPRVTPDRMAAISVPVLLIGAELGGEVRFGQACAPVEANYQRFFEAAAGPTIEITQLGAGHMQYMDDPDCGPACLVCVPGVAPSDAVRHSAQGYLTAFLLGHLEAKAGALTWLESRLAEDAEAGKVTVRQLR